MTRWYAGLALAFILARPLECGSSLAQQAARDSAAPSATPAAGVAPAAEKYTLDNGLRVSLVPYAGDRQAIVLLGVRAGFVEEPATLPHLAHVTEHLALSDLPPPEATAVAEWRKSNKANGETLADAMYFDLQVAPGDVERALRVQAARLRDPRFSRETLLREIPRTLEEIDFVERSPFPVAGKFALAPLVQAALHGETDQPIRARTHAISIDDVAAFHRRTFRPDRAHLAVVGEFDADTVRASIDEHFGSIEAPTDAPPVRPAPRPGDQIAAWDVSTRHLCIAWPAPSASHADHPALTLVSLALLERLTTDRRLLALGDLMPSLNDIDGMTVIGVQAKAGVDLEAIHARIMDIVAEMAVPRRWTDEEADRLRHLLDQMVFGGVDIDTIPLPPGLTKTMLRANVEIQRMMKSLVWGDLDAYRKRLGDVAAAAVPDVMRRYLAPEAASVVRVGR